MFWAIAFCAAGGLLLGFGLLLKDRRPLAHVLGWAGLLALLQMNVQRDSSDVLQSAVASYHVMQALVGGGFLALGLFFLRPFHRLTKAEKWAGAFICVVLVSSLWAEYPMTSFLAGMKLALGFGLVFLVSRAGGYRGLRPVLFGSCVLGVLTTVVFLDRAMRLAPGGGVERMGFLIPPTHPNLTAFVAASALTVWITHRPRRFAFPVLGAIIFVLLASRTRTALFAAIIALGVMAWQQRAKLGTAIVTVVLAAGAVGALSIFSAKTLDFIVRDQSPDALATLTGRTNTWAYAIDQWRERPVLGYGYYTGHRIGTFRDLSGLERSNLDNMWLETLLNLGIVGTLPLLGLVVSGFRRLRHTRYLGLFAVGLVSSFFNPSLQLVGFPLAVWGLLLLGSYSTISTSSDMSAVVGAQDESVARVTPISSPAT